MSIQQPELNPQINPNNFPQGDNFGNNTNNYGLDLNIQNQTNNNIMITDILKKIDECLKQNNLPELVNILKLSQGKINQKILSNYISENLENIDIIRIFLNSGADVNSYIHCTKFKIEENEKVNLLMLSIIAMNYELFQLVLQYHPNVLQQDKNNRNSIVFLIYFKGKANMLHELLQFCPEGINTIYFDPDTNLTQNLLTYAVSKNKEDLCTVLIRHNCNLNYQIPETGDTFLHLIVKNDYIDMAKQYYNLPNIDKSLKNKEGKTAREIGEGKRGNIYFQIICKENSTNINQENNQNKIIDNTNNNNYINSESNNINTKTRDKDIFNKITTNLTNLNNYEEEKNYKYENIKQDKYVVPIEFKNIDYTTYLSMGQDMKLCLNLFKEESALLKQKEQLIKQKEDLEYSKNQKALKKMELIESKNKIEFEIKNVDKQINEIISESNFTKNEIENLEEKNKKYEIFLEDIKNNPPSISEEQINNEEEENINIEDNINIMNEVYNEKSENINNEEQKVEEVKVISEEKFQFLKDKFDSKLYDRSYIVKCLQKDLEDYQKYIESEIANKRHKINDILNQLQAIVNELDPNYVVNLYGSYSTGLCLPWSDIDTVITSKNEQYEPGFLNKLNNKLIEKKWAIEQNFLDRASIPIIKLISADEFNFHIDISMSSENHFGLKTVKLVEKYLERYKVLKPIILALKTLLKNGNLNDPYKGGLSSYGLILMVVSFIQSEIDNEKYIENSPTILGETFLNVLGHYGIFFDYNNYVIITYPVDDKQDSEKENSFQFVPNAHELIIVDPLNNQNNVAKSTFQFMNIKMGFLIAFMVAKEDCECGCHYSLLKNERNKHHGHCILKRIFNSIKRFKDANKNVY